MNDLSEYKSQIETNFSPVSFKTIDRLFNASIKILELKQGQVLLHEGKVCNQLFFLLEGSIRQYSLSLKGEEINFLFYFENDFVLDNNSFISNEVSNYTFVAIQDCKLISISRSQLEILKINDPEWELLHRYVMERSIVRLYKRNDLILANSPEQRYLKLLAIHPQILDRVALAKVASFIGITVPSLSRIRNRISKKSFAKLT